MERAFAAARSVAYVTGFVFLWGWLGPGRPGPSISRSA